MSLQEARGGWRSDKRFQGEGGRYEVASGPGCFWGTGEPWQALTRGGPPQSRADDGKKLEVGRTFQAEGTSTGKGSGSQPDPSEGLQGVLWAGV